MSDPDVWPLPAYDVGQPKHIHALGVAAARYNMLEFALLCLLLDYSGMHNGTTQYLFANLSNNLRVDLLKRCVADWEQDLPTKECILHFASCFNVCAENRNFLMHSTTSKASDETLLNFVKSSRNDPTRVNAIDLRLEDIRKVADDINDAVNLGLRLHAHIMLRANNEVIPPEFRALFVSLPDKPQLPSSLSQRNSPTLKGDQPPR